MKNRLRDVPVRIQMKMTDEVLGELAYVPVSEREEPIAQKHGEDAFQRFEERNSSEAGHVRSWLLLLLRAGLTSRGSVFDGVWQSRIMNADNLD